jgi:hypothetical protein
MRALVRVRSFYIPRTYLLTLVLPTPVAKYLGLLLATSGPVLWTGALLVSLARLKPLVAGAGGREAPRVFSSGKAQST